MDRLLLRVLFWYYYYCCLFHYQWISTRYQWTDSESLWKDEQFLSAGASFWREGRRLVPSARADGSREGCCRGDVRGSGGVGGWVEDEMRRDGSKDGHEEERVKESRVRTSHVWRSGGWRDAKKGGEWRVEKEEISPTQPSTAGNPHNSDLNLQICILIVGFWHTINEGMTNCVWTGVSKSFPLLLSLPFAALWTDSGARFLFQTVQTRLFFPLSAPSSSFWRHFRPTHVVSDCAPNLARVTSRQLSGRFPRSRFLAAGRILAAGMCVSPQHTHEVVRKHTLMWNLVGQMWC